MEAENGEAVVREFVRSFNERDLAAFTEILDPEIELHSMKGLRRGIPEARDWADRAPGGVQQTVVVKTVKVIGDNVLVRIRRDWHWAEDGSLAASEDMAWFFMLRGGRIVSWRPFSDTTEAFAAFNGP